MSSALLERSSSVAAFSPAAPLPTGLPTGASWCVLPRCEMTFEKCAGGLKIHCRCDDEVSCGTLQNLCGMLCDGTCSCNVTCNGIQVICCTLTMGLCTCQMTQEGCCITCVSGDAKCAAMLQACCDALACCCTSGCCCYVSFAGTPVCCGTC